MLRVWPPSVTLNPFIALTAMSRETVPVGTIAVWLIVEKVGVKLEEKINDGPPKR